MPKSWRDTIAIHPAAELFPLMPPDQLRVLGEDIKKNGLTSPIVLWRSHPQAPVQLLDGRNRLDAIEIATGSPAVVGAPSITAGEDFLACNKVIVLDKSVDPFPYVVSANIHRRHLTIEDKDRLIVQLLKADPTTSNRQVAKLTDASHPHVAKVPEHAEKAGDVETVTTSVDTKGRRQPTSKPRKADKLAKAGRKRKSDPPPTQLTVAEQRIDKHLADRARADIGPDSAAEADRLRARNEELARENHRLARENLALRSEVDELKAELAKRAPIDDGLDIPACLRRAAP
jgi:DNA-binding Lrp family transcriptional regulator